MTEPLLNLMLRSSRSNTSPPHCAAASLYHTPSGRNCFRIAASMKIFSKPCSKSFINTLMDSGVSQSVRMNTKRITDQVPVQQMRLASAVPSAKHNLPILLQRLDKLSLPCVVPLLHSNSGFNPAVSRLLSSFSSSTTVFQGQSTSTTPSIPPLHLL